jgi:hypothetical protein
MADRLVILDISGDITCLKCNEKLRYGSGIGVRCSCRNLTVVGSCVYDTGKDHQYSVVPDSYAKVAKRDIYVDVDKTLCLTNEYPFLGELNKPLATVLKDLHVAGYRIIVYSCRTNPEIVGGEQEAVWHRRQIQQFLDDNSIGWFMHMFEGVKPYGAFIVDDKATGYQALVSIMRGMEGIRYRHAMEESDES